ncbi:MAG: MFS transporter [Gammaproteobacteria bacterium]
MSRRDVATTVYDLVTGEEDARVCRDIPEAACNDQPKNFTRQLASLVCTKIGDELASARLVLPWILASVGAPAGLAGLLVPIREALVLVPQLFVAAAIRHLSVRKWIWVGGSVVQGICVAGMAASALLLEGMIAGWVIVGLLVVASLARGACSVAFKDVMGKTVSKTRRGRLTGYASSAAGVATVGVGLWLKATGGEGADKAILAGILLLAAGLWILASLIFAGLEEQPGATEGGGNAGREAIRSLGLLRDDVQLRRFVLTRALLVSTALLMPFYATLAKQESEGGVGDLGLLLVAAGIASSVSSAVWGRMADQSSRRVMQVAAVIAGILSLVVAAWSLAGSPGPASGLVAAAAFLVMGIAHAGIRVGRKTYLVDMATADTRAAYVAVSNTAIGVILLAGGVFGLVAQLAGVPATIGILGLLALSGAAMASQLDEVT